MIMQCPICELINRSDNIRCEFCGDCCSELYEGWFYTNAKLNPFAVGIASSGLMQKRVSCKICADKAKEIGMRK